MKMTGNFKMGNRGFFPILVAAAVAIMGLFGIVVVDSFTNVFRNIILLTAAILIFMIILARAVEMWTASPANWLFPAIMSVLAFAILFFAIYTVYPTEVNKFIPFDVSGTTLAASPQGSDVGQAFSISPVPTSQSVLANLPDWSLWFIFGMGIFAICLGLFFDKLKK